MVIPSPSKTNPLPPAVLEVKRLRGLLRHAKMAATVEEFMERERRAREIDREVDLAVELLTPAPEAAQGGPAAGSADVSSSSNPPQPAAAVANTRRAQQQQLREQKKRAKRGGLPPAHPALCVELEKWWDEASPAAALGTQRQARERAQEILWSALRDFVPLTKRRQSCGAEALLDNFFQPSKEEAPGKKKRRGNPVS